MMYAGVVFFAAAMSRSMNVATGTRAWLLLSPEDTLAVVTDALFRRQVAPAVPVALAALMIAALAGASMVVLERRVRAVEVV
jgi:hypothetical protein